MRIGTIKNLSLWFLKMSKTTKLEDFKNNKKYKALIKDLDEVLLIYTLTIKGLSFYSKYKPLQDTIEFLKDKKYELEIYKKKYNDKLKENSK